MSRSARLPSNRLANLAVALPTRRVPRAGALAFDQCCKSARVAVSSLHRSDAGQPRSGRRSYRGTFTFSLRTTGPPLLWAPGPAARGLAGAAPHAASYEPSGGGAFVTARRSAVRQFRGERRVALAVDPDGTVPQHVPLQQVPQSSHGWSLQGPESATRWDRFVHRSRRSVVMRGITAAILPSVRRGLPDAALPHSLNLIPKLTTPRRA